MLGARVTLAALDGVASAAAAPGRAASLHDYCRTLLTVVEHKIGS